MVAAAIRTIFAQPERSTWPSSSTSSPTRSASPLPGVAQLLLDAKEDLLAFSSFPIAHWPKIWSTNPLERVNAEIKRRTNVVGIFPNDASVLRLVTAVLVEQHDEWEVAERRYLSEESMALIDQAVERRAQRGGGVIGDHEVTNCTRVESASAQPIYTSPRDAIAQHVRSAPSDLSGQVVGKSRDASRIRGLKSRDASRIRGLAVELRTLPQSHRRGHPAMRR